MAQPSFLKPNHKAIKRYYQSLEEYRAQGVKHEGALETAFQRLLDAVAHLRGWQLIPKQKLKVKKTTLDVRYFRWALSSFPMALTIDYDSTSYRHAPGSLG